MQKVSMTILRFLVFPNYTQFQLSFAFYLIQIGHAFINVWPFKGYSFFSSNL